MTDFERNINRTQSDTKGRSTSRGVRTREKRSALQTEASGGAWERWEIMHLK